MNGQATIGVPNGVVRIQLGLRLCIVMIVIKRYLHAVFNFKCSLYVLHAYQSCPVGATRDTSLRFASPTCYIVSIRHRVLTQPCRTLPRNQST